MEMQLTLEVAPVPPDPESIPRGVHFGCGWDGRHYRATVLWDHGRQPEYIGPNFKTPKEAVIYSDKLESQRGQNDDGSI